MTVSILYVVSTPIGNLEDLTPRAVETLKKVDLIAAEDTRHSGRLMQHFAISTPMLAVHDHNERQRAQILVEKLSQGQSIALISDAGTPLISDPGYHLVSAVREAGYKVVPVVGACALIAALSVSGLATDRFSFYGFLPSKSSGRTQKLQQLAKVTHTQVFYESPHRIVAMVSDIVLVMGSHRQIVLARELTKTFETIYGGPAADVQAWLLADHNQQKGEFVVLIEGAEEEQLHDIGPEEERMLTLLLAELPIKKAAAITASITGHKKKALYDRALELQGK
ncbi:16S rRNA (cytidine(1402)-2'-O)-methyltransferase [Oceanospirillaceae bacterium]|jgi:16S rRNA (cytidine1402-2'-O)-methyltransferase|uniref:16S rRNA (cytidine(1402)-2'-O)-methyltransferase n=1 Tax=Candidatus Njordibacter sp. Uisw_002 TaxID=3230971 RepID=UPI002372FFD1|nr:16S rRNA (cytidine(1402)-2'-O)-methyltransferase [Oceanospirillaceae bacterium]MDB9752792.1 16S rRNA (cytidine(1402)-2'-O)-methyltransferase [Oceanospirillaceae bacterium]|tara:strand:+ start:1372 stop:2214 length:843 start_codon:yes stop_codon:yes gene_type:complete